MSRLIFIIVMSLSFIISKAQSHIKVNGIKINQLDKKNRKQGDWIFFDNGGNVRLSCFFNNDTCTSPLTFYENNDTAFIRLPFVNFQAPFIYFKNNQKYFGSFIQTSDSTCNIEIEPEFSLNEEIIREIKKYRSITIEPIYFFAQKKLIDYLSASFSSADLVFNKTVNVLLTINNSGIVSKVEFPADKNNLSTNQERELYLIYSTMPRWQPLFSIDKVRETKIMLTTNSSSSVSYFGQ